MAKKKLEEIVKKKTKKSSEKSIEYKVSKKINRFEGTDDNFNLFFERNCSRSTKNKYPKSSRNSFEGEVYCLFGSVKRKIPIKISLNEGGWKLYARTESELSRAYKKYLEDFT